MIAALAPTAAARDQVVIVNFHGVGEPVRPFDAGEDEVWITRAAFEAALDEIALRPNARVTIDDGNASDVDAALPALVRRGLTATFFVPAGLVGRRGRLTASQVRELTAAGMAVGSHGSLHRPWTRLADGDLDEEIAGARRRLEDIVGRPVDEAACPFGAYDRRSLAALRGAGFRRVYTSDRGPARGDEWLQARNTIHRGDGAEQVRAMLDVDPGLIASAARAARLAVKRWR